MNKKIFNKIFILRLTLIFWYLLCPISAISNEEYEVFSISVSADAESTTRARQIAIEEAQITAFKVLVSKLGEEEKVKFQIDDVQSFVTNYTITNEKMSPKKYRGIINVSFSKYHLEDFLLKNSVDPKKFANIKSFQNSNTKIKKNRILVFPIMIRNNQDFLWEDSNLWMHSWEELLEKSKNEEFILAVGDLEDINLTKDINFREASISYFDKILDKYQSDEILIAIAEDLFDKDSNIYSLNIKLKNQKNNAINTSFKEIPVLHGENLNKLYLIGIENILINQNKIIKSSNIKEECLSLVANVKNMQEWAIIENKLTQNFLISSYVVKKISNKKIYLELYHKQDISKLTNTFFNIGISLSKIGDDMVLELI